MSFKVISTGKAKKEVLVLYTVDVVFDGAGFKASIFFPEEQLASVTNKLNSVIAIIMYFI